MTNHIDHNGELENIFTEADASHFKYVCMYENVVSVKSINFIRCIYRVFPYIHSALITKIPLNFILQLNNNHLQDN